MQVIRGQHNATARPCVAGHCRRAEPSDVATMPHPTKVDNCQSARKCRYYHTQMVSP